MSEEKPWGGSFIPKSWEGTEDLPPEPWTATRVLNVVFALAFVAVILVLGYVTFTTELGLDILVRSLKGAVIGIVIWCIFSR